MRAVILPTPADPFLLHYWFKFFDQVWGSEVHKLYIYANTPAEKAVVDYVKKICAKRPKVKLIYCDHQIEHGEAIRRTLEQVEEEYVMLIEDDCFIFKPKVVNDCFAKIESGETDIVGSKRGSCGDEILKAAKNKWGLAYEGIGDQGPNFWPNLFFSKTDTLRNTDQQFGAKAWYRGEVIEPLEHTVTAEVCNGDTFVNTSLQLRAKYPQERIMCIPQYHGHPSDLEHYQDKTFLFDGHAPWLHVGSLSSGICGELRDEYNRPLAYRKVKPKEGNTKLGANPTTDMEKQEWERRVQWWYTFFDNLDPDEIPEFQELYLKALHRIVAVYELSISRIRKRQIIFKQLTGI